LLLAASTGKRLLQSTYKSIFGKIVYQLQNIIPFSELPYFSLPDFSACPQVGQTLACVSSKTCA